MHPAPRASAPSARTARLAVPGVSATIAAVALALTLAPRGAAQQFTYDSLALPAQSVWTDGVELADVDGDHDVDILFANGSVYGGTGTQGAQPQHLFLNDGNGTFTAAHAQLNVADFNAKMVVADDLDGDGDLDLAYASGSTGSPPRVLLNDGTGVFADVTATNVPVLALKSFAIATGDVDGDGDLDLAVGDGGSFGGTAAQARLLLNDGHAVFTDVTAAQMPADLFKCQDITLLDHDLDGDIDLAISGKAGARLYLNDGSGTFTVSLATLSGIGTASTYEVDWGDLDGDDDFDAAVQSIAALNEGWARNDGLAPAAKTTFPFPNGDDDNEMVCVDLDDDGDLDVVVGSLAGREKAYRNTGAVFANVAVFQPIADSTLDLGFADLDGDGDYDAVTGQGESGNFTNRVYDNAGPADSRAPVLVKSYVPATPGAVETVVEVQLADAISDDGHIHCTVDFSYSLLPSGSGSGSATPMGSGLFRLAVPTPPGTTHVLVQATATDSAGNAAALSPLVVEGDGDPWTDLGSALAGAGGDPLLVGTGTLIVGDPMTLSLTHAAPNAAAVLMLATTRTQAPFKGGVVLATPALYALPLTTDGLGEIVIPFGAWPAGGSGLSLYFQDLIADAAAVQGVAFSNALRADIP
ncbi:MAG TPA: FG-GAP-like repeat-containing protein [Planctomycetota bacterium]|nr:FG-GAP-like repeat-containing protein [Planctomycetota bacterium]